MSVNTLALKWLRLYISLSLSICCKSWKEKGPCKRETSGGQQATEWRQHSDVITENARAEIDHQRQELDAERLETNDLQQYLQETMDELWQEEYAVEEWEQWHAEEYGQGEREQYEELGGLFLQFEESNLSFVWAPNVKNWFPMSIIANFGVNRFGLLGLTNPSPRNPIWDFLSTARAKKKATRTAKLQKLISQNQCLTFGDPKRACPDCLDCSEPTIDLPKSNIAISGFRCNFCKPNTPDFVPIFPSTRSVSVCLRIWGRQS